MIPARSQHGCACQCLSSTRVPCKQSKNRDRGDSSLGRPAYYIPGCHGTTASKCVFMTQQPKAQALPGPLRMPNQRWHDLNFRQPGVHSGVSRSTVVGDDNGRDARLVWLGGPPPLEGGRPPSECIIV
eukprot:1848526-Rhodomonas_salina.3